MVKNGAPTPYGVLIKDKASGELVMATLVEDVDPAELATAEASWKPVREAAVSRLRDQGLMGGRGGEVHRDDAARAPLYWLGCSRISRLILCQAMTVSCSGTSSTDGRPARLFHRTRRATPYSQVGVVEWGLRTVGATPRLTWAMNPSHSGVYLR